MSDCASVSEGDCLFFFAGIKNGGMQLRDFSVFFFFCISCLFFYGISIFREIIIILQIHWYVIWIRRILKYGMKKKNVDCEALEAGMREAFPQITWVSARVSGTRLLIQIKENKIIQDKTAVEEEACDLVSNVSGTITYIMVRQGVPKVKKGEKIEPGQILVSGRVPVIGDDEKEVSVFYVQSQGEILAETGKTYVKEMPLIRKVRYPCMKETVRSAPHHRSFFIFISYAPVREK